MTEEDAQKLIQHLQQLKGKPFVIHPDIQDVALKQNPNGIAASWGVTLTHVLLPMPLRLLRAIYRNFIPVLLGLVLVLIYTICMIIRPILLLFRHLIATIAGFLGFAVLEPTQETIASQLTAHLRHEMKKLGIDDVMVVDAATISPEVAKKLKDGKTVQLSDLGPKEEGNRQTD